MSIVKCPPLIVTLLIFSTFKKVVIRFFFLNNLGILYFFFIKSLELPSILNPVLKDMRRNLYGRVNVNYVNNRIMVCVSSNCIIRDKLVGNLDKSDRKPKKRGGRDKKRGISNLKIAVVVLQDRNGQVIAQKAGTGRVRAEEIDAVIGDYIDPSSLLCTDTATNYKKFALIKELKHETINLSKEGYVKKGIYHLQHVNSYHKRLKDWMQRFQGMATKYLDNYLY